MSWTYRDINLTNWADRVRKFLMYFWGTHDKKYVIDHEGRKIVFLDNSYTNKARNTSSWTRKNIE